MIVNMKREKGVIDDRHYGTLEQFYLFFLV